jgi:hypothetical protein
MATSAQKCLLRVDSHGSPLIEMLAGLNDRDAAAAAREFLDALLCTRVSVVAAVSTPENSGIRAVVTVREVTAAGVAYRTSAAPGASGGEAVGRAVLRAFGVEESVLEAAAERWANEREVRSTSILRADERRQFGAGDAMEVHHRLLLTMPAPGSLAVDAVDAAHRVVKLPSVALACTIAPGGRTAERFDAWARDLHGRVQC